MQRHLVVEFPLERLIATGCQFTVAYSTLQGEARRQAKCCQPWHDPSDSDPGDPSAAMSVTNLRRCCAIYTRSTMRCAACAALSVVSKRRGYRIRTS